MRGGEGLSVIERNKGRSAGRYSVEGSNLSGGIVGGEVLEVGVWREECGRRECAK